MIEQSQIEQLGKKSKGSFFLLDLEKVKQNFLRFKKEEFDLAYAYKSNYSPSILRLMKSLGASAECFSMMEAEVALRCGVKPENIILNGPSFSSIEMVEVIEKGYLLNIDSLDQLSQFITAFKQGKPKSVKIGVRLNLGFNDVPLSRFGIPENQLVKVVELINEAGVDLVALHSHYVYESRSVESFTRRIEEMQRINDEYFSFQPIKTLNIGGGFYSSMPESLAKTFVEPIPSIEDYASILINQKEGLRLMVEPGALLVADAMLFYCKVISIKHVGGVRYATVDASAFDVKPTLSPRDLPIKVHSKSEEDAFTVIVGNTGMEKDVLHSGVYKSVEVGDIIEFSNVGSYSTTLRPQFITPNRPVWVSENGEMKAERIEVSIDGFMAGYQV